jgi:hypothetical protein
MSKFNFHRSFIYTYSFLYILAGILTLTVISAGVVIAAANSPENRLTLTYNEPIQSVITISSMAAPFNGFIILTLILFAVLLTAYGSLGLVALHTRNTKALIVFKHLAINLLMLSFVKCVRRILNDLEFLECVVTILCICVVTKLVFYSVDRIVGEIEEATSSVKTVSQQSLINPV